MLPFTCWSRGRRHVFMAVAGGVALLLTALSVPVLAAESTPTASLTTPYPSMTIQAGQTVTLAVSVHDTVAERLDLSVQGAPSGWKVSLVGAGHPIAAIMTDPDKVLEVDLQVQVPADASETTSALTVVASGTTGTVTLPLSLSVSKVEGATTTLTAEYDSLRGPSSASFTFSLTLSNTSDEARTYNISATGPEKWTLSLRPSGSSQETPTVTVEAGGQQMLSLSVTPGSDATIDTYDLSVTAVGGGETVQAPLQVEITGTYTISLTTPQGNLNADVKAGGTTRVQFVVTNTGTGPLQNVQLSASPPVNWDVTFEPSTIDVLPANQQQTVVAVFKPASNAIAGDYDVTLSARADQATTSADIRVTVKTSTLWGVIGVLIAIAAIAILGFVFRRYGHR